MLELWKSGAFDHGETKVAVGIRRTDYDQLHAGVFHFTEESNLTEVIELCWHQMLISAAPNPDHNFHYIVPSVAGFSHRRLAARCRQIFRAHRDGRVPYGFGSPDGAIDAATSECLYGPSLYGLTCATFVLAVFDIENLPLIDYSTWVSGRPGDLEWQQKVVELLERPASNASQEHIDHVRNDIGSVRFRPEEVAAAAEFSPKISSMGELSESSQQIAARL